MIFLDDGGVMNDNNTRALQWQRLVSEFFVPLLGGSGEGWSHANRVVADRLFELDAWRRRVRAAPDYRSFDRTYQVDWLRGMCEVVGVGTPPEEECLRLARRAAALLPAASRRPFPEWWTPSAHCTVRAIRSIRPLASPHSIWPATFMPWGCATVSVAFMARI